MTLLTSHPHFGHVWESFIIENIINGMQTQLRSFDYYFYRTQHQAEVDLVLQGSFGLVPIEIKTGHNTSVKSLGNLKKFIQDYQCPYGIVINNSERPARLSATIIQLPAGCL